MRRGPKPAKAKTAAKRPVSTKSPHDEDTRVRDLEKRLAEALKREAESLDQQKATSEILRVISRSPTNLQPVLDAIATNAALVCDAYDAVVFLREGDRLRTAAHYGPITITLQHSTLSRGSVTEVAILDRQPVHVHDVLATEPPVFPLTAEAARRGGFRTVLSVPLLRENEAIGALAIRRREVQPFTTQQIDLLKTFADQAVIAIENTRLFNETKEALEQQTATSEILRVISSSPTDVQPVFATIAARAKRLCDARECAVFRFDGELIHLVAQADTSAAWASALQSAFPRPPGRGSITARAIQTRSLVHIPDVLIDPEFELTEAARASSIRSTLSVPMIREGEVIGAITVDRRESKPFLDKQIDLVKIFADQAVIAIENVRLFNETKEALEQQTATAEILRVISSSPTDVQPVFDTIAHNARRLCEAGSAQVVTYDGELTRLQSLDHISPEHADALRSVFPMAPHMGSAAGRAILTRVPVHILDLAKDPDYGVRSVVAAGLSTVLAVPMLRDGSPIGTVNVHVYGTPVQGASSA